jgi:UDP-glucose 4-epimerase
MKILVTGGAGYIGSHTCVELLQANHDVVVIDNYLNSSPKSLERVEKITGKKVAVHELDLLDQQKLMDLFEQEKFDAVIHFAGLKAVGESVAKPLYYYKNNITGSVNLFEAMQKHGVKTIIFSSSATVYGDPESVPVKEDAAIHATNPYGRTKVMIEQILQDLYVSDNTWNITLLRYFNPVGAHPSGLIGEDPNGIPNNLFPFISQVAVGKREKLSVYGNDYPTKDGTGVRDYIHVVDLSIGHLRALEAYTGKTGCRAVNLGAGKGYSVLEVIAAFEKAAGKKIPYEIVARRPGDVAAVYADPSKANAELNWHTTKSLEEMCADSWKWQSMNPQGYAT